MLLDIIAVTEATRQMAEGARAALPDSPVRDDRRERLLAGRFDGARQAMAAAARRMADRLDPVGAGRPPAAEQGC